MATVTPIDRTPRELAYRNCDGLEVSLLWRPADDTPLVSVRDHRTHTAVQFSVAPGSALDAFNHPFAYAPADSPASR
jgi:hypothetical protein